MRGRGHSPARRRATGFGPPCTRDDRKLVERPRGALLVQDGFCAAGALERGKCGAGDVLEVQAVAVANADVRLDGCPDHLRVSNVRSAPSRFPVRSGGQDVEAHAYRAAVRDLVEAADDVGQVGIDATEEAVVDVCSLDRVENEDRPIEVKLKAVDRSVAQRLGGPGGKGRRPIEILWILRPSRPPGAKQRRARAAILGATIRATSPVEARYHGILAGKS